MTKKITQCITHNRVIGDLVGFAPSAHDKRVIESEDRNDVHTLGFELREILDISRQVADGASWSESA